MENQLLLQIIDRIDYDIVDMIRKEARMTLKEMAKVLGYSRQHLSNKIRWGDDMTTDEKLALIRFLETEKEPEFLEICIMKIKEQYMD